MSEGRALVTGASSGIGAAIAVELAKANYDLILAARRKDRLDEQASTLSKAHGVDVKVVAVDLGSKGGAATLIREAGAIGEVDVLVNNAGFGVHGNMADASIERTLEMCELNMTALTLLTHSFLKPMVARGRGRILQIASIGAYQPSPYYAVYSATKAYVLSFSEAVHYELKGTGVSVTTSCPGLTDTEFHDVANHQKPAWMKAVTMTAEQVARISLKAMFKGKRTVIPGFVNWISAVTALRTPKFMVIPLAARTMRKTE
jgi:short-subunit dehydrogenase